MTVIPFRDNIPPGAANPDMVKTLERLLDEAKRGEIIGFAYATALPNDSQGSGWEGTAAASHQLLTAVTMLHHRYSFCLMGVDI